MSEHTDLETYLSISQNEFEIYLFDANKNINLYKQKTRFENISENINLLHLNEFLEENIFKIEKLNRGFVKNIYLIIQSIDVIHIDVGIKKKK